LGAQIRKKNLDPKYSKPPNLAPPPPAALKGLNTNGKIQKNAFIVFFLTGSNF